LFVANIKSQKKRNITNAKAAARNKAVRSELKTRAKTAAAAAGSGDGAAAFRTAQSKLSRAAAKGVVHANQAARRTSRLAKKIAASG
jgi:small subunit ribosomal protein S20